MLAFSRHLLLFSNLCRRIGWPLRKSLSNMLPILQSQSAQIPPTCGFNIFKQFSPSFNLMFPICFPHVSNMWTPFCRFSQGFTDFNWLNWQVAELDAQRDRVYQRQGPGRLAARSDGKSTRRGETMGWWESMFHFCIIWWNSGNICYIYIII